MILPFSTRRFRTSWTSKVLYLASRTPRATFSKSMKSASRRSSVSFSATGSPPSLAPPRGARASRPPEKHGNAAGRCCQNRLARRLLGDGAALGKGHGEAEDRQAGQEGYGRSFERN